MIGYKSALLLLVGVVGMAAASPLSLDDDMEADGRLFTTTNGGFSLSNATFNPGSLLALLLLGILFFVTVGQGFFGTASGSGSGYAYGQQRYSQDSQFYARSDQFADSRDNELAILMKSLESTLESFNVELEECQIYVACEASQVDKHETNGDLAREVDALMRKIRRYPTPTGLMGSLVESFNFGDASYKSKKADACAWFGDQCTAARKAKGF